MLVLPDYICGFWRSFKFQEVAVEGDFRIVYLVFGAFSFKSDKGVDRGSALINIVILPLRHFLLDLLSLLKPTFLEMAGTILEIAEHLALLEDKVYIVEVSTKCDTMLIQLIVVLLDRPSDFFLELLCRILRFPIKAFEEI